MEWREKIGMCSVHSRHAASTEGKTKSTVRASTARTSLKVNERPRTGWFMTWYV